MKSDIKPDRPCIVVVTKRLDRGGTEQHVTLISPALRARGIDIELFLLERGGSLEAAAAPNVPISGLVRTKGRFTHLVCAIFALTRYLQKRRPDAVHFFLPEPYLAGSLAAMMARRHLRLMSRRSLNYYQHRYFVLAHLERWLHRSTSVLLGNSRAVVDQLSYEAGNSHKVGLIYNGIALQKSSDPMARQRARAELGLSNSTFTIVTVANLIAYKGHQDLLEALASIAESLPPQWRLVVVGRDDGIGEKLRKFVTMSGLADHVDWLGERDDVPRILAAADLFVLPSHEEGFSNALIEAMASGLAAVATAVGGNVDAIVDRETGRLVAPHAPNQLATAILELALDSALRQSYGIAAKHRVEQLFSLEACVSGYENLYRGLGRMGQGPIQNVINGLGDELA